MHIPVRTGGIFYFPWHRHQSPDRRDQRLLVSHPKDTGKEGLTELPKFRTQSRPQWESNPAGKNVRSPFKANALTHLATTPPHSATAPPRACHGHGHGPGAWEVICAVYLQIAYGKLCSATFQLYNLVG